MKAKKVMRNLMKIFLTFVITVAFLQSSMMTVSAASYSEIEKKYQAVYDYNFYRTHNADLQNAFGNDEARYINHFIQSGMAEGRQAKQQFNLTIYKSNYADLRQAFGNNNVAYYEHYVNAGQSEGRNAQTLIGSTVYGGVDYSAVYQYEYYKANNPDLAQVFGNNPDSYIAHFVNSGMAEGRQAKQQFNLSIYKSNYADLRQVFGNNNVAYYKHYMNTGQFEGRNAQTLIGSTVYGGVDYSAVYQYEYYKANNSDLAKVFGNNPESYLAHFVNSGMSEGRQASSEFNLAAYKYNYSDLCRAFGDNNKAYYMHYISTGKAEGRNAKSKFVTTVYGGVNYAAVYKYEEYKNYNTDLVAAFGNDPQRYLEHFVNTGMAEGRQGNSEFNLSIYKANYADLCSAFGNNNVAYYRHYMNTGKAEGRNAKTKLSSVVYEGVDYSAVYRYQDYKNLNPDLKNAFGDNESSYLAHFVNTGMAEGRQGNVEFNLAIYKKNYSDLCEAFGNNNERYYRHYMNSGKAEGRNASQIIVTSITFDANGGYLTDASGQHVNSLKQSVRRDHAISFPSGVDVYNNNKVFAGWYANKAGTGNKVTEADITWGTDMVLYAKWQTPYTVTFNANGGYFDGDGQKTTLKINGSNITVQPIPEHADKHNIFSGWYYDAACTQAVGNLQNYTITKDIVFYAKWESGCTVTFQANGGYFESTGIEIYQCAVKRGSTVLGVVNPIRNDSGVKFCGWYLESSGVNAVNLNSYAISTDITFYAKWETDTCKIVFDANGGYFAHSYQEQNIEYWSKGLMMHEAVEPAHYDERKYFDGWYYDKACTSPVGNLTDYTVTGNITFYAKWEDGYLVTLNANGGYFTHNNMATYRYSVQRNSRMWGTIVPVNSGKTFSGWYYDAACTKAVGDVENYMVSGDITFYAKWISMTRAISEESGLLQEETINNETENVFASEPETEANSEPETEANSESETEANSESETEANSEPETN